VKQWNSATAAADDDDAKTAIVTAAAAATTTITTTVSYPKTLHIPTIPSKPWFSLQFLANPTVLLNLNPNPGKQTTEFAWF
jgi:hypothetical protein